MGITITALVVVSVAVVTAVYSLGSHIKRTEHWTGDHIQEIAGSIGYNAFFGVIFSYFFAFNGELNGVYSNLACIGFMTFLYPFLGYCHVVDWPGDKFKIKDHGKAALSGMIALLASVMVLSLTIIACSLNNGTVLLEAIGYGAATFVVASTIFLLGGLMGDRLTAAG